MELRRRESEGGTSELSFPTPSSAPFQTRICKMISLEIQALRLFPKSFIMKDHVGCTVVHTCDPSDSRG